jgi:hypothetical protein
MLRPAFAIFFSLALTGCIFLVDSLPDGTSTTCQLTTPPYSSGTNACKTCITSNCQSTLNVCCADSTCQAQLNNVDSCANQDGCSALAAAGGTEGATSDLIACIASECGSSCSGIDAAPADGSSTSCSGCKTRCASNGDGRSCSCVAATGSVSGNQVACTNGSFGRSVCCASQDYPSVSESTCVCEAVVCDDSAGYCACQRGSPGSATVGTCTPPSGGTGTCCLSVNGALCTCDPNDPCDQVDETPVEQCSAASLGCAPTANDDQSVTSCSVL